jgi:hypothetical protein
MARVFVHRKAVPYIEPNRVWFTCSMVVIPFRENTDCRKARLHVQDHSLNGLKFN